MIYNDQPVARQIDMLPEEIELEKMMKKILEEEKINKDAQPETRHNTQR
jgi:hypothetical protein